MVFARLKNVNFYSSWENIKLQIQMGKKVLKITYDNQTLVGIPTFMQVICNFVNVVYFENIMKYIYDCLKMFKI